MSRVVFKYLLDPDKIERGTNMITIEMQRGAVLSVQEQRGVVYVWALVNPSNVVVKRRFLVVATGQPFDEETVVYQGTFQLREDGLVFHLFEISGDGAS